MNGLHHIALGARDVEEVAAFYRDYFGCEELARHTYAADSDGDGDGRLRSVWLKLGEGRLMVEHTEDSPQKVEGVGAGPFLIAFDVSPRRRRQLEEHLEAADVPIEERSDFTSYVRDPEGNRVAFSHYPEPAL